MVAAQGRGVAQQKVRHQHGHGAAHVRVRRHQRITGALGLVGKGRNRGAQLFLQQRDAPAQIQPQVQRHLLVARATGVQAAAGIADTGDELALDEAVDVFVDAVHPGRIRAALLEDGRQRLGNRLRVGGGEHAGVGQRLRPRQASGHVVFEQAAIKRKGDAKIKRRGIGSRVEAAGPKMLGHVLPVGRVFRPAFVKPTKCGRRCGWHP